jgi:hypothetical protein
MPDAWRDEVERVAIGLTELASMGLDPKDGSLEDDPNPMRLRTYEDEHLSGMGPGMERAAARVGTAESARRASAGSPRCWGDGSEMNRSGLHGGDRPAHLAEGPADSVAAGVAARAPQQQRRHMRPPSLRRYAPARAAAAAASAARSAAASSRLSPLASKR